VPSTLGERSVLHFSTAPAAGIERSCFVRLPGSAWRIEDEGTVTAACRKPVKKSDPPRSPGLIRTARADTHRGQELAPLKAGYIDADHFLRTHFFTCNPATDHTFFFEIEHYGAVLNANRTYYLTRSQPPFLSSMVVDVYNAAPRDKPDLAWLERAYADLGKVYRMWTSEPHLAGSTELSRYYDFGEGPPPEAVKDETGFYRKVAIYFLFHPVWSDQYVVETESAQAPPVAGADYSLQVCEKSPTAPATCEKPESFQLSADYYKGDRSMRESGFDVSFRFGPFGAATHHYAAVCLNTLLYKNEKDLEQISRWLGREADAKNWAQRAEQRKRLINQYLWNPEQGFFFDYNFATKKMSTYRYATTFYPLWAGLATPEQAKAVAGNLKALERPGGLAMSSEDTGAQWDLPYGWGNIEMLVVEGLRRYGYKADADRISYEFLSMVADNFRRDGNIREKYNVVTRSSESHVELGYKMNVVGFGWTNAAFLELLHDLPKEAVARLEKEASAQVPLPQR
jgi:alpha,alpha-trehalase